MQSSQPRPGMSQQTALIQQLLSNQQHGGAGGSSAQNTSGFNSAHNAALASALMSLGGGGGAVSSAGVAGAPFNLNLVQPSSLLTLDRAISTELSRYNPPTQMNAEQLQQLQQLQQHQQQVHTSNQLAAQHQALQQQSQQLQQLQQQLQNQQQQPVSLEDLAKMANRSGLTGQGGGEACTQGTTPMRTRSSDSGQKSSTAYATRHQAAEQRRRTRINERLELLRKIVPHTERANTASFLEEVIKYIDGLKRRTVDLEAALSSSKNARLSAATGGGNPHHQAQQQQSLGGRQEQQQHQQLMQQQLMQQQLQMQAQVQQLQLQREQQAALHAASMGANGGGSSPKLPLLQPLHTAILGPQGHQQLAAHAGGGSGVQLSALELALNSGLFQQLGAGGPFAGNEELYAAVASQVGGAAGMLGGVQLQAQQLAQALAQAQQQALADAAAAAASEPAGEQQAEVDGTGEANPAGGGMGSAGGGDVSADASTSETPASSEESGVPIKKRKVVV